MIKKKVIISLQKCCVWWSAIPLLPLRPLYTLFIHWNRGIYDTGNIIIYNFSIIKFYKRVDIRLRYCPVKTCAIVYYEKDKMRNRVHYRYISTLSNQYLFSIMNEFVFARPNTKINSALYWIFGRLELVQSR